MLAPNKKEAQTIAAAGAAADAVSFEPAMEGALTHISGALRESEETSESTRSPVVRAGVDDHGPALSARHLAELRAGVPGEIRSGLLEEHVARALNHQLGHYSRGAIRAAVWSSDGPQWMRSMAYELVTQYGSIEQLSGLARKVEAACAAPGRDFYCPADTSLGASLYYLGVNKGILPLPWRLPSTQEVNPGSVVVLDEVVLDRLARDTFFRADILKSNSQLLCPRGWIGGVTPFRTPSLPEINERVEAVLTLASIEPYDSPAAAAKKIEAALDFEVVSRLSRIDSRLSRCVEFVDAPGPEGSDGIERIARQLNGCAGISPSVLRDQLDQFGPEYRDVIKELLVQHAHVHSHISMARGAREHGRIIRDLAGEQGVALDDVCFLCPDRRKSFGMYGMIFRQANPEFPLAAFVTRGGLSRWLDERTDRPKRVVILDDIAGSGESMKRVVVPTLCLSQKCERRDIVLSPLIASEFAVKELRRAPVSRECLVRPASIEPRVVDGRLATSLPLEGKLAVRASLGAVGFSESGAMIALPYMSPDNNVELFARGFAPYFTLSENAVRGWLHGIGEFAQFRRQPPAVVLRTEVEAKLNDSRVISDLTPNLHSLVEHERGMNLYWNDLPECLQSEMADEWAKVTALIEEQKRVKTAAQLNDFAAQLDAPGVQPKDALRVSIEFGVLLAAAEQTTLPPETAAAIAEFRSRVMPLGLRSRAEST